MKFPEFSDCALCPRACHVNRNAGEKGYCNSDSGFHISTICRHQGEEPAISGKHGICNIFFLHCNLQCIYCQNHQISCNELQQPDELRDFAEIMQRIFSLLDQGCKAVGFVSPSHFVPHVHAIIGALHDAGRHPVIVYNSNGYDSVEELKKLEGMVDIYLPDLKYMDAAISASFSDAPDYPLAAQAALKEMFRQKGDALLYRDEHTARSGMIIRHLVLPGQVQNSIEALKWIAQELSPELHISLMSQYYPAGRAVDHPQLGRTLGRGDYKKVVAEMERLGMYNGWLQELDSHRNYRPDFDKRHPFE